MHQKGRPRRAGYSDLLLALLLVWDHRCSLLFSSNSMVRTFLGQSWFRPGEDPSSFRIWRECGLTRFRDVSNNGRLCSRQELESKIKRKLPWLEYSQVAHLWNHGETAPVLGKALTQFETLLLARNLSNRGLISTIYAILNSRVKGDVAYCQ